MSKKNFKKVLVVLGGTSGEREISIETGKACIKALKKKKYIVDQFDPKYQNINLINRQKVDVIFNALHGKNGEDGVAQSYFEYLRIPYTHSGVISSYNAMNKVISKKLFIKNKILTPRYCTIKKKEIKKLSLNQMMKINNLSFPLVIKPIDEGSSLGVKIVNKSQDLKKKIKFLLNKYDQLILEQYIGGKEIQSAVLNKMPLGAIELVPKRTFYDYKAKYLKSAKTEHIMPANLKKKDYSKVLNLALKAHKALNCKGVTRADFKFFKGRFYLLEINTQPGMTSLSLVPEIANYRGVSFENLVEKILLDASLNR